MHRSIAALATIALAATSVVVASPAQAYDRDAYSYAAGHMIERSDIPAALGKNYPRSPYFSASVNRFRTDLCFIDNADPDKQGTSVDFPSGRFGFEAMYFGRGKGDPPSIDVQVNQYRSATKAIAAFNVAKKQAKKCTGTSTNTYTDPEDGSTNTYSTLLTNGVVPMVTTVGVESIFVSSNSLSTTTPGDDRSVNDRYQVVSLVNDVVLITTYYNNTNDNITTKQRKAVNQVAFNAIGRWVE